MNRTQIIRMVAGILVLTSIALGKYVNVNWFWLGIFVGANLLQSSFTKWCLLEEILKKRNIPSECDKP
ncbi:MAG: DUF2892 domain-containing protein [Flavobacteriales bacterium]|nr:DUF2892 domain-containing protein [Flavobacteriales bacterium]